MPLSTLLLALVPAAICLTLSFRPAFFEGGVADILPAQDEPRDTRNLGAVVIVVSAVVVPLFLWLLWREADGTVRFSMLFTALAACWGAYRIAGLPGALIAPFAVLACSQAVPGSLWIFGLLSLCAGLGGAQLVLSLTGSTSLLIKLVIGLTVFDVLWIASGVGGATVALMPGLFSPLDLSAPEPAVYNRILVGDSSLGTGDIFLAAVVACILARWQVAARGIWLASGVYLAVAALMFTASLSWSASMPATVPGLVALAIVWMDMRRRMPAARVLASDAAS